MKSDGWNMNSDVKNGGGNLEIAALKKRLEKLEQLIESSGERRQR